MIVSGVGIRVCIGMHIWSPVEDAGYPILSVGDLLLGDSLSENLKLAI